MLAGNALRHQMILSEQRAIYDYWRAKCSGNRLPTREDISPSDIVDYLPTISLIERCEQLDSFKFRLAGTGFYDIYKRELTGHYIEDMPDGSRRDYWNRVLTRVAQQQRPSAGVVRSNLSGKTHMAQFWIRLPLASKKENRKTILGFDKFVKLSEIADETPAQTKIYA